MTSQNNTLLGLFTKFSDLPAIDQQLVLGTWAAAERAYIPRSNFPVGATILAANEKGETKIFTGCNVENQFFTATICAERNAATTQSRKATAASSRWLWCARSSPEGARAGCAGR